MVDHDCHGAVQQGALVARFVFVRTGAEPAQGALVARLVSSEPAQGALVARLVSSARAQSRRNMAALHARRTGRRLLNRLLNRNLGRCTLTSTHLAHHIFF